LARALEASMAQFNQEQLRKPNETYRFVGMRLFLPVKAYLHVRFQAVISHLRQYIFFVCLINLQA
jgi:hypothetical protein